MHGSVQYSTYGIHDSNCTRLLLLVAMESWDDRLIFRCDPVFFPWGIMHVPCMYQYKLIYTKSLENL